MYRFIENDAEIIYEGRKLRLDTSEGVQRAEAFIRMKEVVDPVTGLKVPRTKVSFCYNSLTPKAPSEPFALPCLENRARKRKGENIMTHCVMRFPEAICVPIPVRTQATRTVKSDRPVTAKIALEIGKKWVKQTYGSVDYMCGIHIDQNDMLLHFLLCVREANPEGEEIARQLFCSYKLDQYLPELNQYGQLVLEDVQMQSPSLNEPSEEFPEKMTIETISAQKHSVSEERKNAFIERAFVENSRKKKLYQQELFSQNPVDDSQIMDPQGMMDFYEETGIITPSIVRQTMEDKEITTSSTDMGAVDNKILSQNGQDNKQAEESVNTEPSFPVESAFNQNREENIDADMSSINVAIGIPNESSGENTPLFTSEDKATDVQSVVARVRASLAEEHREKEARMKEENSRKSFVSTILSENAEFDSTSEYERTVQPAPTRSVQQGYGRTAQSTTAREIQQSASSSLPFSENLIPQEIMRSHENERQQVKIIDKVPVVGEDPLEQIKKNAMQLLSSIHEQDYQKEQPEELDKTSVSEPMQKSNQDQKETLHSNEVKERLANNSGSFLSKLGKTEDEMLYDESEYAGTPKGEVVWGAGAEKPNLFAQLPEEQKIPSISFFVQNENGEKEVPEEFIQEPTYVDLQQQNAAKNYVSNLRKKKMKKVLRVVGISIIAALILLAVILLIKM